MFLLSDKETLRTELEGNLVKLKHDTEYYADMKKKASEKKESVQNALVDFLKKVQEKEKKEKEN